MILDTHVDMEVTTNKHAYEREREMEMLMDLFAFRYGRYLKTFKKVKMTCSCYMEKHQC